MKQTENGWQVCDVYNVSLLFVKLIKDLEQNQTHNQQQIPYFIDMITSAIKIVVQKVQNIHIPHSNGVTLCGNTQKYEFKLSLDS